MPLKISTFLQRKVRNRAGFFCEYCHADERWQFIPFTIDHIIPLSQGGTTSLENLALACFNCNRHKSDKQFVGETTLFNPRKMVWNDHFSWSKDLLKILSKTEIGRVTVELLQLNRQRLLIIRAEDIKVNRHPPADDSVEI